MKIAKLGQQVWTNVPSIHQSTVLDMNVCLPWVGVVVKIIGNSVWVRDLRASVDMVDTSGFVTAIANKNQLFEKLEDVPCESP